MGCVASRFDIATQPKASTHSSGTSRALVGLGEKENCSKIQKEEERRQREKRKQQRGKKMEQGSERYGGKEKYKDMIYRKKLEVKKKK